MRTALARCDLRHGLVTGDCVLAIGATANVLAPVNAGDTDEPQPWHIHERPSNSMQARHRGVGRRSTHSRAESTRRMCNAPVDTCCSGSSSCLSPAACDPPHDAHKPSTPIRECMAQYGMHGAREETGHTASHSWYIGTGQQAHTCSCREPKTTCRWRLTRSRW